MRKLFGFLSKQQSIFSNSVELSEQLRLSSQISTYHPQSEYNPVRESVNATKQIEVPETQGAAFAVDGSALNQIAKQNPTHATMEYTTHTVSGLASRINQLPA